MEHASAASPLANRSDPSNLSLVPDWRERTSEYSDAQLVLLAVTMATLVLVIVFGKWRNTGPASQASPGS